MIRKKPRNLFVTRLLKGKKNGGRSRTRIYDLHDVNGIGFVDSQRLAKQNSVKFRKLLNLMALFVLLYAVVAPC